MMASFSEGLLLSEKVGLDPNVLVEVYNKYKVFGYLCMSTIFHQNPILKLILAFVILCYLVLYMSNSAVGTRHATLQNPCNDFAGCITGCNQCPDVLHERSFYGPI